MGECEECRKKQMSLQRRSANGVEPSTVPSIVHEVLRSPGQSLDSNTRAFMEPRFGHDFSQVRVHTDAKATESARAVNALAYTVGQHVVFGSGQHASFTTGGRQLLTHELTHVVQQRQFANFPFQHDLEVASDHDSFEREARMQADMASQSGDPIHHSSPMRLQRVGIGETIVRFFGGGTFSEQELQDYLRFLDENDHIEDSFDSDNKAREIVKRWKKGESLYILPVRRKILLIQEMQSGFTGDDDERAILDLLRGSTDDELSTILTNIGEENLKSDFHGAEGEQLDQLLAARQPAKDRKGREKEAASSEVFPAETILELEKRFKSNSESANRLNCILIIRELAPKLFGQDPEVAKRAAKQLGELKGKSIMMTEFGRVLSELGLVSNHAEIRFDNGNGLRGAPSAMQSSAWDTIIEMVGNVQGWHVFGLAVFNGYHSVTVLVDNRPDGPRVYWADQWRIDPGEDFYQEPGSVSGFRLYKKEGFDQFIQEKTTKWWNEVHSPTSDCAKRAARKRHSWERSCKWSASLHIWKFRSSLEAPAAPT